MNCLHALAIAAAALVASGEPVLQPLIQAPVYIARGEALLRTSAANLEARFEREHVRSMRQTPDGQIHAVARFL